MRILTPTVATLLLLVVGLPAKGENPGQAALDEATTLKLEAQSLNDLGQVIELAESAIKQGLDEEGEKFAKQMVASTAFQRGEKLAEAIIDRAPVAPQWPQIRSLALIDLEKAVKYDSQLGEAYYLIGQLYALPGGDRDKAQAAAGKAVALLEMKQNEKQSELSKALVLRGSLSENPEQRIADFKKALELEPDSTQALRARGLAYLAADDFEKAAEDLKEAIKKNEGDLLARQALAETLIQLEKYDEAAEQATAIVQAQPKAAAAYLLRARVYSLQDENKQAISDLDEALKLQPQNLGAILLRGRLHLQEDQFDEARKDVQRLLKAQPGMPQALLLRSIIAASEKKFEEAIKDLRALLKDDPGNTDLLLQLAAYLQADDRPRAAIEVYNSVLSVDEDDAAARHGRGDAYLSIGKHQQAVADFEVALKEQKENSGLLNNFAWVLATSPDDEVRNADRAIKLATQACELTDYKAAHILSTLASAYAEKGNFEEARKWSSKAVELGEGEVADQLKEELESYKQEKPWRERQETEEKKVPKEKPDPSDLEL